MKETDQDHLLRAVMYACRMEHRRCDEVMGVTYVPSEEMYVVRFEPGNAFALKLSAIEGDDDER